MTRQQALDRVHKVFWDVFDDDTIRLNDSTTAKDVEDWDSLAHMNLIVAIEEEFGMRFTMGEVTGMKNVGEMLTLLENRAKR
jgi:acyl carrier protein